MSLTAKQERFCLEYVLDYNATQAAIRAGYSEDTARQIGSENLSKPVISSRIIELGNVTAEEIGITKRWILTKLQEAVEVNWPRWEIGYTATGRPVPVMLGNANAANKALELLARHSGMLIDHQRIQIDLTTAEARVDAEIERLSALHDDIHAGTSSP